MNIVYALTRNIYDHLLPSINSLYKQHPDAKVYILCEDDEFPLKIPFEAKVVNVSNQKYFPKDNPNMNSVFTYMAMVRACYADLFPRMQKVIQLDIDTLVMDSLEPLWKTDLTDKWFAACPEYEGQYNPFGHDRYYNIGVCLFNLQQMRKDGADAQLVDLLNSKQLKYLEQDALNIIGVPDKVVDLPVRYNECFCCGYTDNPAIVHFAGYLNWWVNKRMYRRELLDEWKRATKVEL